VVRVPLSEDQIKLDDITKFRKLANSNLTFVATGVDHQSFVDLVQSVTSSHQFESGAKIQASNYVGGGELRIPTLAPHTTVKIVFNGDKAFGERSADLAVAVQVLGRSCPDTQLGRKLNNRFAKLVESKNLNWAAANQVVYSDAGLFVVAASGPAGKSDDLAKILAEQVQKLEDVTEQEFESAKKLARLELLKKTEDNAGLFEFLQKQIGSVNNAVSVEHALSAIDSVSLKSLRATGSSLLKSKPVVYAQGAVHNLQPL